MNDSEKEKEKENAGEPDTGAWSKAGPSGKHKSTETAKVASPHGKPKDSESLSYSEVSTKGKAKLKKPHEV